MKEKVGMTDNKNTNYENQLEVKQILLKEREKNENDTRMNLKYRHIRQ